MPGLRCLRLLDERRNRQDSHRGFQNAQGLSTVTLHELFTLNVNSKGTRGHTCNVVNSVQQLVH